MQKDITGMTEFETPSGHSEGHSLDLRIGPQDLAAPPSVK
jgi:hypothetical protein